MSDSERVRKDHRPTRDPLEKRQFAVQRRLLNFKRVKFKGIPNGLLRAVI